MIRAILLACLTLLLFACTPKQSYDNLTALPIDHIRHAAFSQNKTPVIGIAFGGGGIRGFIHLGVIRALTEAGIRADVVTGTSAGAIAASFYASGMPYPEIEKTVLEAERSDLIDFTLFSAGGFVHGEVIAQWIKEKTGKSTIETMPIPLGITVTDLSHQESLLIVKGDVGQAVQASVSLPGAFIPYDANGSVYVDGGV